MLSSKSMCIDMFYKFMSLCVLLGKVSVCACVCEREEVKAVHVCVLMDLIQ